MNTPQGKPQFSLEDAEDLTLYADEEFDTDDVDLFEFTSLDDSPLTLLKSIILSLDWEITDELLQDLVNEVQNLQESFAGDKVVQVYLQGLEKIGNYIRSELAYAHPNSIKLLLTYYYNLERIISSPNITNDEIVSLLKADVRKFKILQYQISPSPAQAEEAFTYQPPQELPTITDQTGEVDADLRENLRTLKAVILELDWEIDDEALDQFFNSIAILQKQFESNTYSAVLLNGLNALGSYISEARARTHPEAFSLLHSFYQALEKISHDGSLEDENVRELIVNTINSFNNLKEMLASREQQPEAYHDEYDLTAEETDVYPSHGELEEEFEEPTAAKEFAMPSGESEQVMEESAPAFLSTREEEDLFFEEEPGEERLTEGPAFEAAPAFIEEEEDANELFVEETGLEQPEEHAPTEAFPASEELADTGADELHLDFEEEEPSRVPAASGEEEVPGLIYDSSAALSDFESEVAFEEEQGEPESDISGELETQLASFFEEEESASVSKPKEKTVSAEIKQPAKSVGPTPLPEDIPELELLDDDAITPIDEKVVFEHRKGKTTDVAGPRSQGVGIEFDYEPPSVEFSGIPDVISREQMDIDEELDRSLSLFLGDEEEEPESAAATIEQPGKEPSVSPKTLVSDKSTEEIELDQDLTIDLLAEPLSEITIEPEAPSFEPDEVKGQEEISPALFGEDFETLPEDEAEADQVSASLNQNLAAFFGEDEEKEEQQQPQVAKPEPTVEPTVTETAEQPAGEVEEIAPALFADEAGEIIEEAAEIDEQFSADLDNNLAAFFGADEEEEKQPEVPKPEPIIEETVEISEAGETEEFTPALLSEEAGEFPEETPEIDKQVSADLDRNLASFFDTDELEVPEQPQSVDLVVPPEEPASTPGTEESTLSLDTEEIAPAFFDEESKEEEELHLPEFQPEPETEKPLPPDAEEDIEEIESALAGSDEVPLFSAQDTEKGEMESTLDLDEKLNAFLGLEDVEKPSAEPFTEETVEIPGLEEAEEETVPALAEEPDTLLVPDKQPPLDEKFQTDLESNLDTFFGSEELLETTEETKFEIEELSNVSEEESTLDVEPAGKPALDEIEGFTFDEQFADAEPESGTEPVRREETVVAEPELPELEPFMEIEGAEDEIFFDQTVEDELPSLAEGDIAAEISFDEIDSSEQTERKIEEELEGYFDLEGEEPAGQALTDLEEDITGTDLTLEENEDEESFEEPAAFDSEILIEEEETAASAESPTPETEPETVEGGLAEEEQGGEWEEQESTILFFGDQTLAHETADSIHEAKKTAAPAVEETEPEEEEGEFIPALADSLEVNGFRVEEELGSLQEEAPDDLEDTLDEYFQDIEPQEEPQEVPLEETVAEVAPESLDTSELGEYLAALTAAPSEDLFSLCSQKAHDLQAIAHQDFQQAILLRLLESTLSLQKEVSQQAISENFSQLINYLFASINQGDAEERRQQNVLVEAVSKFTDWQKNMYTELIHSFVPMEKQLIDQAVAKEVKSGLDEIRNTLKQEIESLRRELKNP